MSGAAPGYTGDVEVGGAPATRELRGLRMTKVAVGSYNNNAYLLECTGTGERLLIDAAAEATTLLDVIGPAGLGHTLGSLALVYAEPDGHHHVWTGDALFPGGVGKTHEEPALFDALLGGVESKLFDLLGDDTWIYPGHGSDTTLGAERPHLPAWRERGW